MCDVEIEKARIEAIGWAWAEACCQLDAGKDPRQYDCSELMDRANKDLADKEGNGQ